MVVVFGTVCLDRVRRLPRLPTPGGYVEVLEESVALGGEAANTALALRAWGGQPILASNPLGDDPEGHDLRDRVLSTGLDLRELSGIGRTESPVCDVLVTPNGERTMIGRGFSRLDGAFSLEALPLSSPGLFAADPNFERTAGEALRRAAATGMRCYAMDFTEGLEGLGPELIVQVSAEDVGARGNIEAARVYIEAQTGRIGATTILTDGPFGVVVGGPKFPASHFPAFPTPRVVDTTGAGDLFRAGMLHGLEKGWSFNACLRFASAAGALSVSHPGASTRIPRSREIEALISACPEASHAFR